MTATVGKSHFLTAGTLAAVLAAMALGVGGVPSAAVAGETVKYSFQGGTTDGATPYAGLSLPDSSGNFYGATYSGGSAGQGTVYQITSAGAEMVLYSLPGTGTGNKGAGPIGTPVFDGTNVLGTAVYNNVSSGTGSGDGVVYEVSPVTGGWSYTVLHSFAGGTTDGANPYAGLSIKPDANGNYYGTTSYGSYGSSSSNDGVIFEVTKSGTTYSCCTQVHSFAGGSGDGANGYGGVAYYLVGTTGTLYGTTVSGGSSNDGVAFSIAASGGTISLPHTFTGSTTDGGFPRGGIYSDGTNLFGTTSLDGASGKGIVFELKPSGTGYALTILHSFAGGTADGSDPWSTLVADSSGNLWGTATSGGAHGYGTIFELVKGTGGAFTYSTKYSFSGGTTDGATPYAGLTLDSSGNLWGTTTSGGANGYGVVFEYTP